jgi:excisionase family DNA binding protein
MTQLSGGDWLSAAEVADMLGVTRRYVNRLVVEGKLPAVRVGVTNLFLRRDAEAFKKAPRPGPGRPKK